MGGVVITRRACARLARHDVGGGSAFELGTELDVELAGCGQADQGHGLAPSSRAWDARRMPSSWGSPTVRLRRAHFRAAVSSTPCPTCSSAPGVPCQLDHVLWRLGAVDTVHLARHRAWLMPAPAGSAR